MEDTLPSFVTMCNIHRATIKDLASRIKGNADLVKSLDQTGNSDKGEMIANLMLSYRHLEDASMRLGKAIQAHDGGMSVYDKNTTVGVDMGVGVMGISKNEA